MDKVDNIVKGEVKQAQEETTKNGKTFYRVVVEASDKPEYPNPVAVDFWGDKVEMVSGLTEGSEVEIHVNIRGREYNGNYYTSLTGWKVDLIRDTTVTKEVIDAADKAVEAHQAKESDSEDTLPI